MGRRVVAALGAALMLLACEPGYDEPTALIGSSADDGSNRGGPGSEGGGTNVVDSGTPVVDAGVVTVEADAGVVEDAGTEVDAGVVVEIDGGVAQPDAGVEPDAGTPITGAGPWPTTPVMNYSTSFGIGSVQSVGVDDAQNIWLLSGAKIGVLRPGTTAPVWVSNIGQAAPGWGPLASGSTVICGGTGGRAYVGYTTYDPTPYACSKLNADGFTCDGDVNNPEYQKGDVDVVKLGTDGNISLEVHLQESVVYQGGPQNKLGIRNTNNWTYDEDRSVFTCGRIAIGPNKNDVFIGTNHGVTMIRGTVYNAHRHPVWDVNGSLRIGYNYALGFSFDQTKVLMGNEWKLGILNATASLGDWDRSDRNPWIVDTFNDALNSLADMDYWRGFTQVKNGDYYLSSSTYGLWRMFKNTNPQEGPVGSLKFARVTGLPTDSLTQVWGTKDGSLFIGTNSSGLWKLAEDNTLSAVQGVPGSSVKQLVYDPSVTPASLYVVTNAGLTVLRGF